jgi:hypothetical protein
MRVTCSFSFDAGKLPRLVPALRARVSDLALTAANRARADMYVAMVGAKAGRAYVRGNRVHIASAPGQAPAVDTGMLLASLQAQRSSGGSAIVYAGAEYAVHLEFGTVGMAPRPFFRKAAIAAGAWFVDQAASAVGRGV